MKKDNIFQPVFDRTGPSLRLSGYNPFSEPIEIRGNKAFGTRYGMYLGTIGKGGFRSSFLEELERNPNYTKAVNYGGSVKPSIQKESEGKEAFLRNLFVQARKIYPGGKPPRGFVTAGSQFYSPNNPRLGFVSGPITQKGNSLFKDGVFLGTADASANPMSAVQTSANPMDAVQQSLMGSGATNPSYSSPLFG